MTLLDEIKSGAFTLEFKQELPQNAGGSRDNLGV